MLPRISLAHLPTPIARHERLSAWLGIDLWVKRDDMTGGPEAGNKLRKLEFLFAAAKAAGAVRVVTCGGWQSNHARATAVVARELGFQVSLFLRATHDGQKQAIGNLFLDTLLGADIHFISQEQYAQSDVLMRDFAEEQSAAGERTFVIPEGGSNALGALGYFAACQEMAEQLRTDDAAASFDSITVACGSGGTAAGLVLGAHTAGLARVVDAVCVCDNAAYFKARIGKICDDAETLLKADDIELQRTTLNLHDQFIGPGYGETTAEQRQFIVSAARHGGIVLDPTYSGKALYALAQLKPKRALFIHTGGLPGLLAQPSLFAQELAQSGDNLK